MGCTIFHIDEIREISTVKLVHLFSDKKKINNDQNWKNVRLMSGGLSAHLNH